MSNGQLTACRLIVDAPASGSWNMAVDETLLETAVRQRRSTLRFYRWREATVSLGYFQDEQTIGALPELAELPVVRRLSGGGAILHQHELTYSCAIPATSPLTRSPHEFYDLVHDRVISILGRLGITARLRGGSIYCEDESFFCFGRQDAKDILVQGCKILGSAQRRRRGALLQHGSLLLRRSRYAPRFPGLLDLAEGVVEESQLVERMTAGLGELLGADPVCCNLDDDERRRARRRDHNSYQSVTRIKSP